MGDIHCRISPHPSYIFYKYQTGNGGDTDVEKKDIEDGACSSIGNTFGGKDHRKDGPATGIGRKNKTKGLIRGLPTEESFLYAQ